MKARLNLTSEQDLVQTPNLFLVDGKADKACVVYLDPTDEDRPDDPVAMITHRQLLRLVFMATETGVRFEREKMASDPVNWILTPKALFDGQAPVDACQQHDAFLRGIILHGLSLGLDADSDALSKLLAEDDDDLETPAFEPVVRELHETTELSAA